MTLILASALLIPLTLGGLSTSSPVYQRAIAIGNFAGQLAGQQAQAQENACISGVPLRSDKSREAMMGSSVTIAEHWKQLQSGDAQLRAGTILLPMPVSFTAAGDGDTAIGHWEVRRADGRLDRTFTAMLREKADLWLIERIDVVPADQFVEPLLRYCHTQGDILAAREKSARAILELKEKEVAERDRKAMAAKGTAKEADARQKAFIASDERDVARRNLDSAVREPAAIAAYRAATRAAFEASRR